MAVAAVLGSGEQHVAWVDVGVAAARIIPFGRRGNARYTTSTDMTERRATQPNRPMCGLARGGMIGGFSDDAK